MFLCWRINSYPITYGISKSSRAPNPIIRASPLDGCRHRVPAYAKFPSKRSFALARLIAPSSLAYLFIGKNPPAECSFATEEFPLLFCYQKNAPDRNLEALEAKMREPWYGRMFASPPE